MASGYRRRCHSATHRDPFLQNTPGSKNTGAEGQSVAGFRRGRAALGKDFGTDSGMATTAKVVLNAQEVVKVLRVDVEEGLALLLVAGPEDEPLRTRWSFLKNLPPGLLDGTSPKQPEVDGEEGGGGDGREEHWQEEGQARRDECQECSGQEQLAVEVLCDLRQVGEEENAQAGSARGLLDLKRAFDEQSLWYSEDGVGGEGEGAEAAWKGRYVASACLHGGTTVPSTGTYQDLWSTCDHQQEQGQQEVGGVHDHANETCHHANEACHHANEICHHANETCHHANETCHHANETCHHANDTCRHANETCHHANEACHHANEICHHANETCHHANEICHHANETCHHANDTCRHANDTCHHANDTCQADLKDWARPLTAGTGPTARSVESNPGSEDSFQALMSDGDRSDFSPEDLLAISPEIFSGSEDSLALPTARAEFVDLVPLARPFPSAPTGYPEDGAASGSDDLLLREAAPIATHACQDETAGMSSDRAAGRRLEEIERGMVSLSVVDRRGVATAAGRGEQGFHQEENETQEAPDDNATLATPCTEFVDHVPPAWRFLSSSTPSVVNAAASGSDGLLLPETASIATRACRDRPAGMSGHRATARRLEIIDREMSSLSVVDEMMAAAAVEEEKVRQKEKKWEESLETPNGVRNAGNDVGKMSPLGMESRPGICDLLVAAARPDEPSNLRPPTSSSGHLDDMREVDGTHPSASRTSNPTVLPAPPASLTAVSCGGATSDVSLSRATRSTIERVQVRRSTAFSDGRGVSPSGGGSERAEKGTTAGLGVVCERALKEGEVVFEEKALLWVSLEAVEPAVWAAVTTAVTAIAKRSGLSAMDLLQAVAFNNADPSTQDRVLQLFAPEPDAFPAALRRAWDDGLDALHQAGALSRPATCSAEASSVIANDEAEGSFGGGVRAGTLGGDGGEGLGFERRCLLSKVLMICETNIFGEHDHEEVMHGSRSLFELACRINHSCLPNCSYHVQNGAVTVRAMFALEPGTELLVSYLPIDDAIGPTLNRQDMLNLNKYFDCQCDRCTLRHDLSRGLRCPRCHKGAVYPPNPQWQPSSSGASRDRALDSDRESRARCDQNRGGFREALGVSPCLACGLVPTAKWLESVERVEMYLVSLMWSLQEEWDAQTAKTTAYLYAAASYLFLDHHLMCSVHLAMARFLKHEGRTSEEAYHLHQMLVVYSTIFGRPTQYMVDGYVRLANSLLSTGLNPACPQVAHDSWIPPPAGRCGAYASLVQTPHPRCRVRSIGAPPAPPSTVDSCVHRVRVGGVETRSHSGTGLKIGAGVGGVDDDCVVCHRRHGDLYGSVCGGDRDVEGRESRPRDCPEEDDRFVYFEDCQGALRKAIQVLSGIVGSDAREVLDLCEKLEETQIYIAGVKCGNV